MTQGKDMFPAMTVDENLMIGAYTRSDRAAVAADKAMVISGIRLLEKTGGQSGTYVAPQDGAT